ncbi:EAL domain-containing protein [Klebsiella pneumoniae]|nr:EAL domain-containing protein [Klebsiella pneumoniae]
MFKIKKHKFLISILVGLMISSLSTVLAWQNFYHSETDKMRSSAKLTVDAIDRLLDEARSASVIASPMLNSSCSNKTKEKLGRLVISREHVRVISLFKEKHLFCSSYNGARSETEDSHVNNPNSLIIFKDNHYISPGEIIIVLRSEFPEGSVTASITAHWIADSLKLMGSGNPFSLRIGNAVLTNQGVLINQPHSEDSHAELSLKYPFSVIYPKTTTSFLNFMKEDIQSIVMSLLLGCITSLVMIKIYFREKSLSEEIEMAIKNGEIVPWYQPVIDSTSNRIIGVEVLARWIKPDGEVLPPHYFIPEAENSNLIIPLTRQLMKKSAQELAAFQRHINDTFHVGFNITQKHILETGFITECLSFLDAFPGDKIRLTVELSEREHFNEATDLNHRLRKLQSHNIAIALDDFGTGYANIDYLGRLHVDIIKIDRCFISKIGSGKEGEKLLETLIGMIKITDSKIIAEGVVNREQQVWLRKNHITWLQGFLYSAPVPADKLHRWF